MSDLAEPFSLPESRPRRPLEEDQPGGYHESDSDFLENNREIAAWSVEHWAEIRQAIRVSRASAEMVEIGERVRTEDNRATSHPIFLVEERERIYGVSSDYTETFAWLGEEGEIDEVLAASLEAGHRARIDPPDGFRRVGYLDRWIFATACLTEDGAKAYIAANGHNLRAPRIYVASAYRNLEWQAVRAFLLGLAGGEQ